MKRLCAVLVVTLVAAAMPAQAKAVFVNLVIDDLGTPVGPTHTSSPGGTTIALGAPNLATMRTLTGRPPGTLGLGDPGALRAGQGFLGFGLQPDETATYGLLVATDFVAIGQPAIVLMGLTISSVAGSNLLVEMLQDGVPVGSRIVSGAGPHDVIFSAAPGLTSVLSFRFTGDPLMARQNVIGLLDTVVANPEPGTMGLIALGVLGGGFGYRRRRQRDLPSSSLSQAA